MNIEKHLKDDVRLFALETIVTQYLATVYTQMPREIFDAVQKQSISGARGLTFPAVDAATSDMISAEIEEAMDRLYKMIQSHLDKTKKR